ncbi:MAG: thioredoxin family protein [Patescibacteria group bacterium]
MMYSIHTSRGIALPAVLIVIATLLVVGGGYYYFAGSALEQAQCPADAKLCSDGSAVGRTGPNCEFAACPGDDAMKKDDAMMKDDEAMMKEDGAMMDTKDDAMMQEGDSIMLQLSGTVLAGSKAPLIDFNKADYDKAIASDKLVVLYFYADWCPICRAEFPKMQQAFHELSTDKVVGFRVNYKDDFTDADEMALARQFGVAYQHTKIFLKGGQQILKAPDSWEKARYTSEINKLIQ